MIHRSVRDRLCEPDICLSWSTSEIRVRLAQSNMFKLQSIFTDRSKAVLLLRILYVICVSCLSCCLVCSLQPCGQLLGKGWPLGSAVQDVLLCFCHLPIWCPGSGVVFDCLDSWSLHSSLLFEKHSYNKGLWKTYQIRPRGYKTLSMLNSTVGI